jgi:hypothetical protein
VRGAPRDTARAVRERGGGRGGSRRAFDVELATEFDALVGPGAADGLDLGAIEVAARRRALALAARAVERRLDADTSDHAGPTRPCACGGRARYAGRRPRTFTTALGELTIQRAHYHCAACGAGTFPRDVALGLVGTSLSPAVTRMVGLAASMVSFAEGSELLDELAGVAVDPKAVERTAEALGREVARDEQAVVVPGSPSAPVMYLGMDGTGLPMRPSELVGRAGKQPDGSARTREAKLVTTWTAQGRDSEGIPVRDPGSVSYSAAIESAATHDTDATLSAFGLRVEREAVRRGFDRAERKVVIGDGATWIWKLADELFPGAVEVVDLFHAKEHLSDVGKAVHGPTSELARTWARQRHEELDTGRIDDLLAALAAHAPTSEEARKCHGYVTTNRERMRYPEFRAAGLCVSSGVVEAGCKVAIGTRLKRAGMHWTLAGADAIIALRCCKLSGRFEGFWERRSRAARVAA